VLKTLSFLHLQPTHHGSDATAVRLYCAQLRVTEAALEVREVTTIMDYSVSISHERLLLKDCHGRASTKRIPRLQQTRTRFLYPIRSPLSSSARPILQSEAVSFPRVFADRGGGFRPFRCGNSSNNWNASNDSGNKRTLRGWIETLGDSLSMGLPIWVGFSCLIALMKPAAFNWVTPKLTVLGLTVVMLGMGMTLTLDDLRGAFSMSKEMLVGIALQYSVMPLSGYCVSKLLQLPSHYAAGLILVGCCPGGTASNVITYIAGGNVALSVLMTAASTVLAVVMTPFLTARLAGQFVAVNAKDLVISTMQVVLLPVLAGAFLNQYFQSLVKFVLPLMPPIAVSAIAILSGSAIAQSSSAIYSSGAQILLASCLLHSFGFFFGYTLSQILGIDVSSSRTISIEVGMQNSALGVVLATQHFGSPLTAVPSAMSGVCQSIIGSTIAWHWRRSAHERQENIYSTKEKGEK
ncbi:hypothetical protein V2J09_018974, partial [Rumex salicifolius]